MKREKLKKILEKDDTMTGVEQFQEIMKSTEEGALHQEDLNLLLRWAVQEQKKYFRQYYAILKNLGANVNFIDTRQNKSNLMIACEKANLDIVETLVQDESMNFLLQDKRKRNALYYAIENRYKEKGEKYVKLVLGKDPSLLRSKTKNNSTLLISAIQKGKLEIVRSLLNIGADPNEKLADNGNTPLHEAVKVMKSKITQNNKEIVQCLLEKGADASIKNNQNKNVLQMCDKRYEEELMRIMAKVENSKIKPLLKIGKKEDREQVFSKAAAIYQQYEQLLSDSQEEGEISDEDDTRSFQNREQLLKGLTKEIQRYEQECLDDYHQACEQVNSFLATFNSNIAAKLNLYVEVYGSFATGLWLKHCNVDFLLTPKSDQRRSVDYYLDEVAKLLEITSKDYQVKVLKNRKVPVVRVEVMSKKVMVRKMDITILDMNHNGKQHLMYANQLRMMHPELRPLFYIVKKMTYFYKLNDTKNNGIRSYAIILMLALFFQQYKSHNLGDLLLKLFYKFGYSYDYDYMHSDDYNSLFLNLPDPVNPKNNVGSQTDVFSLQRMFKVGYLILHSPVSKRSTKLQQLFDSRNMFF